MDSLCSLLIYLLFFCLGMCPEVPSFPYKQIRNRFKFLSLLTSKEAIDSLNHVRTECGRVVSMHLFHHSGATKHLKLEEFQLAQSQATIQVCVRICAHMCVCGCHVCGCCVCGCHVCVCVSAHARTCVCVCIEQLVEVLK